MTNDVPVGAEPLVSCVMIFYNAERFIEEAIDSVLKQRGFDAWELILVDDGSTDASTAIALRYAESDPRIRYVEHPGHANRGMSASRNAGARLARGEFLAFLDSDDVWLPNALRHRVSVLERHPDAEVLIGGTWWWHSWSAEVDATHTADYVMAQSRELEPDTLIEPPALYGAIYRDENCWYVPAMCSVIIRRSAFWAIGGMVEDFHDLCEDQVLYAKVGLQLRAVIDRKPLALYRQHPASTCARADADEHRSGARSKARDQFIEWMTDAVREIRGVDSEEWEIVMSNQATLTTPADAPRRPKRTLIAGAKAAVPPRVKALVNRALRRRIPPPVGAVRLGDLRRTTPIAADFGYQRGGPVDRYYIESFLERHADDVRGRVLEVGDDSYTRRFGRGVTRSDVLHVRANTPGATITGDLSQPGVLPRGAFDCIILTQTLHLIYDYEAALKQVRDALAPNGVLLLTVPGISHVDPGEWGASWHYSFTEHSVERMTTEVFSGSQISLVPFGNVLAAVALLHGLGVKEIPRRLLDDAHHEYSVIHAARVRVPAESRVGP